VPLPENVLTSELKMVHIWCIMNAIFADCVSRCWYRLVASSSVGLSVGLSSGGIVEKQVIGSGCCLGC